MVCLHSTSQCKSVDMPNLQLLPASAHCGKADCDWSGLHCTSRSDWLKYYKYSRAQQPVSGLMADWCKQHTHSLPQNKCHLTEVCRLPYIGLHTELPTQGHNHSTQHCAGLFTCYKMSTRPTQLETLVYLVLHMVRSQLVPRQYGSNPLDVVYMVDIHM